MEYTFPMRVLFWAAIMLLFLAAVSAVCDSEDSVVDKYKTLSLKYKGAAIASMFAASAVGVCLPSLGKRLPALRPGGNLFLIVKSFAGGAILSTGFVQVLQDAFDCLTSPCLPEDLWFEFPFTGFIAMVAAIVTLMADAYAMAYFRRRNQGVPNDEERQAPGHTETLRHRVVTQVLMLAIIIHSVIIGIALGALESPKIIKSLIASLTFHQFFKGIGLGGCISQAKFTTRTVALMAVFFAITTSGGIGIGIAITNTYKETSSTTLVIQGILSAASAGILIYVALVDLLAADFMSPELQSNGKLQLAANISLLAGAGCVSLIAKWV